MRLIDTHAHIFLDQFDEDLEQVVENSIQSGVEKVFMPNIDSSTIESMLNVESRFPHHTRSMMGLHPTSVKANFEEELAQIESFLFKGGFSAVGEIGTDLYWDDTFWEQQKETLRIQLDWATQLRLPAILHSRDTIDENIEIVQEKANPNLTGIFHCFTGTVDQAKKIIDAGFIIGLGGVITFKNSNLDEVIRSTPLNKIVLETDSPYLAPVPFRGKRNEPAYLTYIISKIADVKGIPQQEVAEVTTQNALSIFQE